jgi:hypothetical protein
MEVFLTRLKFVAFAPLEKCGGLGNRSGHFAKNSARAAGRGLGIRQERAQPVEQGIHFVRLQHPLLDQQRRRPNWNQRRIGLDPLLQLLAGRLFGIAPGALGHPLGS